MMVGECIYCGYSGEGLQTEHIIPYSFSEKNSEGDVLLKASCDNCAKITKAIEQFVTQELFGNIRKVFSLRSRRGELPKVVEQKITDMDGTVQNIMVPVEDLKDMIFLPVLGLPGMANNNPAQVDCGLSEIITINVGLKRDGKFYIDNRVDYFHVQTQFRDKNFEKFLLKIGYCTAIKNFGIDSVRNSPIPKILLGYDKRYGAFLGKFPHDFIDIPPSDQSWLQYGSYETAKGIVSSVRLFAAVEGTPEYHIIITLR